MSRLTFANPLQTRSRPVPFRYRDYADRLRPLVQDTVSFLHGSLREGKSVLVEGANAAMLDIDFGTSSSSRTPWEPPDSVVDLRLSVVNRSTPSSPKSRRNLPVRDQQQLQHRWSADRTGAAPANHRRGHRCGEGVHDPSRRWTVPDGVA